MDVKDVGDVTTWIQLVTNVGFPVVFTGGILWLAWRYVPMWFEANMKSQAEIADSARGISDTLREHLDEAKLIRENTEKLKDAAHHAASAAQIIATANNIGPQVQPHVDMMKEALR